VERAQSITNYVDAFQIKILKSGPKMAVTQIYGNKQQDHLEGLHRSFGWQ
jgi:hypothetical protein